MINYWTTSLFPCFLLPSLLFPGHLLHYRFRDTPSLWLLSSLKNTLHSAVGILRSSSITMGTGVRRFLISAEGFTLSHHLSCLRPSASYCPGSMVLSESLRFMSLSFPVCVYLWTLVFAVFRCWCFFFADILDPLMLPLFNDNRYICFDYHRIDIASQNLVVSWALTEVLLKSTL